MIDHVVGVGGMGVVYAAHDPKLERKVAIKVLRPNDASSNDHQQARIMHRTSLVGQPCGEILPVDEGAATAQSMQ